jgi:hypothetical protein
VVITARRLLPRVADARAIWSASSPTVVRRSVLPIAVSARRCAALVSMVNPRAFVADGDQLDRLA